MEPKDIEKKYMIGHSVALTEVWGEKWKGHNYIPQFLVFAMGHSYSAFFRIRFLSGHVSILHAVIFFLQ